ncbi:phospholipid carrier-dependent glycosyltransferase [Actinomycetaceae bacterium L2_0104]
MTPQPTPLPEANEPVPAAPVASSPDLFGDRYTPADTRSQSGSGRRAKLGDEPLTAAGAQRWEVELRGRLGITGRLPRTLVRRGWIAALLAGVVAFVTRFWNLNHPHALVFDETYYVKGAFSLRTQGFEGNWTGEEANEHFLRGDYSVLSATEPDYVVHPPLGKWLMAAGQALFGGDNGVGWRFTTAILGVASVLLLVYIALRLFRSPLLAGFAGLAMALDGMGIVMSRTGILDNILAFFTLAAFATLLLDRDRSRSALAHRVAHGRLRDDGRTADPWGPRIFSRPWMLATGILLGLACGVKWSAIYAVAVFGIVAFVWGVCARRTVGVRLWFGSGVFREGVPAFIALVPVALITYLATWYPWFRNPNGYFRNWAQEALERGEDLPLSWAPDALNSLIHYHQTMWTFHNGLSTPHDYQSQAWQWLVQARPVSFFWTGREEMTTQCPDSECVQAITSVGNPAVWWFALIGLAIVLWAAIRNRDWRAWSILAGYLALWAPWLIYVGRTIFQFYAVAFLPFVVLSLTYGLAFLTNTLGRSRAPMRSWKEVTAGRSADSPLTPPPSLPSTSDSGQDSQEAAPWWQPPALTKSARVIIGLALGIIVAAAAFWMPLWWGTTVDYQWWQAHMWFPSWI